MSFYDHVKIEQDRLWTLIGELEGKIGPDPKKHLRLRKQLRETQQEYRVITNWIEGYEHYIEGKKKHLQAPSISAMLKTSTPLAYLPQFKPGIDFHSDDTRHNVTI